MVGSNLESEMSLDVAKKTAHRHRRQPSVATAAYLILVGNAPGFRNSREIDAQRPCESTERSTPEA
jgi:hypothetical protein